MKISVFLPIFFSFFVAKAFGNMAEYIPIQGQLTGAPLVSQHCTITHEDLVIDMQSAGISGVAHVNANYNFTSDTLLDHIQLVFVANNLDGKRFHILLDNIEISGDTTTLDSIPASWKTPEEIQLGDDHFYLNNYRRFINRFILFSIPISKGNHTISVTYDALLTQFGTGPTISYELLYMLSPVKNWKDYQGLDLKVAVPENWIIESNLQMKKEGIWHQGKWKTLPADFVFVKTRYSDVHAELYLNSFLFGCWGLIILLIIWRLIVATKKFVAGKNGKFYTWSLSVWTTLLGVILFYVVFFNRENVLKLIYSDQAGPDFDRGDYYAIMGFPFLWIFGILMGYIIQGIAYKVFSSRKS